MNQFENFPGSRPGPGQYKIRHPTILWVARLLLSGCECCSALQTRQRKTCNPRGVKSLLYNLINDMWCLQWWLRRSPRHMFASWLVDTVAASLLLVGIFPLRAPIGRWDGRRVSIGGGGETVNLPHRGKVECSACRTRVRYVGDKF